MPVDNSTVTESAHVRLTLDYEQAHLLVLILNDYRNIRTPVDRYIDTRYGFSLSCQPDEAVREQFRNVKADIVSTRVAQVESIIAQLNGRED